MVNDRPRATRVEEPAPGDKDSALNHFARQLKSARQARFPSSRAFSRSAQAMFRSISRETVRRYEAGNMLPPADTFQKVLRVLQCAPILNKDDPYHLLPVRSDLPALQAAWEVARTETGVLTLNAEGCVAHGADHVEAAVDRIIDIVFEFVVMEPGRDPDSLRACLRRRISGVLKSAVGV